MATGLRVAIREYATGIAPVIFSSKAYLLGVQKSKNLSAIVHVSPFLAITKTWFPMTEKVLLSKHKTSLDVCQI